MGRAGVRLSHLGFFREEDAIGPLQRDEALLLAALVRVTRPRTLLEFGFSRGHSAMNFMEVMGPDAKLYSFDIDPLSREIATTAFAREGRFKYIHKSQTDFEAGDVDGRMVDFCFIDAAHDLTLNQETWRRIALHLSERAIVAVHDTGTWHRERFTSRHVEIAAKSPQNWIGADVFQPHKDERQFVNWICEQPGGWSALHLHTNNTIRHGVTVLQRGGALPT